MELTRVAAGNCIGDLERRLVTDHNIAQDRAQWVVRTWAQALGLTATDAAVPSLSRRSDGPVTDLSQSDRARLPVQARAPFPGHVADPGRTRLVVDALGGGDFRDIASAYAKAKAGETIVIRPGTYRVSLVVDRDVRFIGEGGRGKVILVFGPNSNVFTFTDGAAMLTGLTIRVMGIGPPERPVGAIAVTGGTPHIEDCELTSSAGSALYVFGATANPLFRNCSIRDSRDCGVYVYKRGKGTIENCVLSGNGNMGMKIASGGNPTVRDCTFGGSWGILVRPDGLGTFSGCDLRATTNPWIVMGGAKIVRTGNRPVE